MRILLVYNATRSWSKTWYQELATQAPANVSVEAFCITPEPPRPQLSWDELNQHWLLREKRLMHTYHQLVDKAMTFDVLLHYNGYGLHPDVLHCLPTFNVYSCFDDPESSDRLSAPVANKFDAVFHGNIASAFQYQQWGCNKIAFLPIFTAPSDVPSLEETSLVLQGSRSREIVFIGELSQWRTQRLKTLVKAFPQAIIYGDGWPNGRASEIQKRELYLDAKLSWNIHNSTGPINRRLYELAAFGILQLCDNKTGLGQIFRLGDEVVGFDSIPEAIELTNYYLKCDSERIAIIEKAYRRYWMDYSAVAIWRRIIEQLQAWGAKRKTPTRVLPRSSFSGMLLPAVQCVKHKLGKTKTLINRIRRDAIIRESDSLFFDERGYLEEVPPPYRENPEMAHINMAKTRLENGEPLEWPSMVALNWSVTSLIGKAKHIVDIAASNGTFAIYASVDTSRTIYCLEGDDFAREKAMELRSRVNINYYSSIQECPEKQFDLLVAVDIIEHVDDLRNFLKFCLNLSPRAIITTPNRNVVRNSTDCGPPVYKPHVREFDPGELYWVLRQYYSVVHLFHMPNAFVPWLAPMTIATHGTPIIAECSEPYV